MENITTTLNLRLPDYLRNKLETLSKENEVSISEMARTMIEVYGENSRTDEEMEDILCNNAITQIVAWLYQKKINPYALKKDYRTLHYLTLRIKEHEHFSLELKKEFLKVEKDLDRIMKLPSDQTNYFEFPLEANPQKFNYQLLEKFIDGIKHMPYITFHDVFYTKVEK